MMIKKLAVVGLGLLTAVSAFAQSKTVTNNDLEKFRQQRLEAERQLKDKYVEMGTTEEEVEREIRRRRAAMEAYSDQLLIARVAAENMAARQNARRQYEDFDAPAAGGYYYGYAPYFAYAPYFYGNRSSLSYLRNLPPNARTVQEYAIQSPTYNPFFNLPARRFPGGVRGGKSVIRPRSGIRFGARFGFGRWGF